MSDLSDHYSYHNAGALVTALGEWTWDSSQLRLLRGPLTLTASGLLEARRSDAYDEWAQRMAPYDES